ncbi:putative GRX1-glutaredoxin [Mrakia frigida]|uniref:glutaredoxin n=1 Tax=Mrakia frigida TaxID=29902 RepID=UPI003FCC2648
MNHQPSLLLSSNHNSPQSFKIGSLLSTPAPSQEQLMSVKALVDTAIAGDFIAVFSKSYCPYCKKAKSVLKDLNLPEGKEVKVYELDERDDGADIQNYLAEKTGQRTVPNIFIQGKHVGGSDDLAKAKSSGTLTKLIQV